MWKISLQMFAIVHANCSPYNEERTQGFGVDKAGGGGEAEN